MPSPIYRLFREALLGRKQIICRYQGFHREVCPHLLGRSAAGEEVALVYQFAGESQRPLPQGGGWKCFRLATVTDPMLRDGAWRTASGHSRSQSCVVTVEYDVNPASPYMPSRGTRSRR